MDLTIFELAILVFSSTLHLLLGGVVLRQDPRGATNRLFFLLVVLIVLWSGANYLSLYPPSLGSPLFWIRLVMFFAAPLSMTLLLFIYTFPNSKIPMEKQRILGIVGVTITTMIVALSPFLFTRLEIGADGSMQPQPGLGMLLFVPVGIGGIIAAMGLLVKKLVSSQGSFRAQLRSLFVGTGIFWGLVIVTIFVPVVFFNFSGFVPFSPVWSLAFSVAVAYAIVRHRFLNIRLATTVVLIVSLLLLLLFRFVASAELQEFILNGVTLLGTAVIGYFLIRATVIEIKRRERVETLFVDLEKNVLKLKDLNETKTEVLSIASHQLRAPLTAIKGFLSMLVEGDYGSVTEEQQKAIKKTMEAEEYLISLVGNFLDFSRIEAGRVQVVRSSADIGKLVSSIVEELKPLALEKNLILNFVDVREPIVIPVDAEKLRQVFVNIIDNAIKYTDTGKVTVTLVKRLQEVVISVRDTGKGMGADEIKKVFQKFTRGREAAKHSVGSGLGLYIANEFTKAHSGRIEVESEGIGKGSVFSIILPLP